MRTRRLVSECTQSSTIRLCIGYTSRPPLLFNVALTRCGSMQTEQSGYGVGCLRACLDVMLSALEGDEKEMVPLHKGQHRLLTNLTGAGLQVGGRLT